jgi:hypothetical protein
MLIYIKLNFSKVRFKIITMLNTRVNKNFILYRFLFEAS